MAFSVPLLAAASENEAVRLAYDAMALGADAIMCQWSPRFISAATEAGVPVQGHAGLVPRKSTWTGGLRAVGKTLDEALWVYREIKALEDAGAYAVEVEVIPEGLLAEISKRTSLLTSSIGGGNGGDIQFLFADDILGNNPPPYPRHSKQYCSLFKLKSRCKPSGWPVFSPSSTTSERWISGTWTACRCPGRPDRRISRGGRG
ncbi:MAG: hypothetical protein Ct9H300mP16_03510 [Pseudomonadota bacterium]|nr:MAG: hypothetical protein Ct9H300mP16_03510 [Pseudomonadota bacterium]